MSLCAEHVTVRRQGRAVLSDVSLRFEAHGCIVVVGANGAGKTTLLQTLLGFLKPAQGRVILDDSEVRRLRRRDVARRIAYVPQQVNGFAGFRVDQIVEAARYPHRHPLEAWTAADRVAVEQALRECGLEHLSHRAMDTLSGGERQSAWIAAALAQDAQYLLLDEPAASLDPRHQVDLVNLLRRLADAGRTVIVVAHDVNLAGALAERVVALREGRVVFDDAPGAFFEPQVLMGVFDTEFVLTQAPGRRWPIVGLGR